ncbi:MAG TPA: cysteine synthase A [Candidatus Akkermansia intestinigallinarum]|uniref:Cysteine synthase n=1 Tax=Candidatus Akkermansia intestinigallinarum TaxID=2838431 RepID=A0A9D2AH65_9BACT|nr:cysteine synthase A [Candidatus Akkermansia intestinigallinarum]
MIHHSVTSLIGHTPLFEPQRYNKQHGLTARLLLKLEYLNPAGSVKDRVALSMIEQAEAAGQLREGAVIIEPTSGNTGIGLAAIAASRGYRCILTMPETMSVERRNILRAYGAEIVLTPGAEGMKGAIARAEELAASTPGSLLAGQFSNPANPEAHYRSTGPEIWQDCDGDIDILVAGIGTGGTISGCGRYLRERKPELRIIGVEPASSAVLSGGAAGPHAIQGIGAGFIPATLDTKLLDEVVCISNEETYGSARELGRLEGILVGVSGSAALLAATRIAARPENSGKTIVAILPDSADRYYSTPLFG